MPSIGQDMKSMERYYIADRIVKRNGVTLEDSLKVYYKLYIYLSDDQALAHLGVYP